MSGRMPLSTAPLRFVPSMEVPASNEAETNQALIDTMGKISQTTLKHSGHAIRSVHAKRHGVLRGEFTVLDALPPELAQGLFASPGRYEAVVRFSTIPGDILDDSVSTPHGVAVKLVGVPGPRLPGSEGDRTQDFIMVNSPAFSAPTPEKFLGNLKALAATTDHVEGLKKVVSAVARGAEAVIEAFGAKSPTITTMGGQKLTHILGDTFYSQVPILYGDYIAKFSLVPVGDLAALAGAPVHPGNDPNALRTAVSQHYATSGGDWELRVQLCTDLETMPIEDASVIWPEDRSPYITVAILKTLAQESWSPAVAAAYDDGLSFSPWHGLAAHRPLGGVMRARNSTYASSAGFRARHNGCPIHEPKSF